MCYFFGLIGRLEIVVEFGSQGSLQEICIPKIDKNKIK